MDTRIPGQFFKPWVIYDLDKEGSVNFVEHTGKRMGKA